MEPSGPKLAGWPKLADYPQMEDGYNRYLDDWISRKRRAALLSHIPTFA